MSRARLGLYVFARVSLFQNCLELTPTFTQLVYRPLRLHLMPAEQHPTDRDVSTSTVHVVNLSWNKMFLDPLKVTYLSLVTVSTGRVHCGNVFSKASALFFKDIASRIKCLSSYVTISGSMLVIFSI